ncbi:MAG TPA: hypothetical protein PLK77_03550 [Pyrinomonadaceae bacterium]|nr:hypothetical protein [Pyrinomonadaceae bacterium]
MNTAIETTATIGTNRQLILDEEIPARVSEKVRVIVLIDEDIDERQWHRAAERNDVFDLLADESEDIYSVQDGFPITA